MWVGPSRVLSGITASGMAWPRTTPTKMHLRPTRRTVRWLAKDACGGRRWASSGLRVLLAIVSSRVMAVLFVALCLVAESGKGHVVRGLWWRCLEGEGEVTNLYADERGLHLGFESSCAGGSRAALSWPPSCASPSWAPSGLRGSSGQLVHAGSGRGGDRYGPRGGTKRWA